MGVMDFFKSVPTMSAEEVRRFIAEKKPDEYNLVDVRQPGEYERDHIPGANLIPMAELQSRLAEIDPEKPTITY
ncbi:MAG: rhodanese-like domain-containing protein [Desulfobulbales bacterium]|nr:rhodanese-like domain-containing protein [Desulfobulbales bacterium]